MAVIDDGRAKLLAGQAAQLRENARKVTELLRQRRFDELEAVVRDGTLVAR